MSDAMEVLCAGIIVADHLCMPIAHVPAAGELVMTDGMLLTVGGCAANAAGDLAKMGVRVAICGRVGNDVFGGVVTDILRDAAVDVSALKTSSSAETSQTLIVNVAREDRRFIHTFGANREFSAADLPTDLPASCKVLYVGGFLVMPGVRQDELVPLFKMARSRGIKTVLDVVIPAPGRYVAELDRLLPHVDVFLPNQHEAELITGEEDPRRQGEFFRKLGADTVVITMGGEGAVLVQKEGCLRAGSFRVPCVDASGGGDAFDAGYIYGLLRRMSTVDCLRYASALGASCVRAVGTTPGVFTRAECEAFLDANALPIMSG